MSRRLGRIRGLRIENGFLGIPRGKRIMRSCTVSQEIKGSYGTGVELHIERMRIESYTPFPGGATVTSAVPVLPSNVAVMAAQPGDRPVNFPSLFDHLSIMISAHSQFISENTYRLKTNLQATEGQTAIWCQADSGICYLTNEKTTHQGGLNGHISRFLFCLERVAGFEPATFCLGNRSALARRLCSYELTSFLSSYHVVPTP